MSRQSQWLWKFPNWSYIALLTVLVSASGSQEIVPQAIVYSQTVYFYHIVRTPILIIPKPVLLNASKSSLAHCHNIVIATFCFPLLWPTYLFRKHRMVPYQLLVMLQ